MANTISEFPCIEANRCLVTEKDMGWRLTVKAVANESDDYTASFTKAQSSKEEWYMHLDVDRSFEVDEGAPRRILQLRHGETGQYLSCDEKGRVSCDSTSSDSTWWWMKRVSAENSPANDTNSPQTSELAEPVEKEYILVSKKFPLRRLGYTKGLDESEKFTLIASKNASTDPSIWTLKFTSGELCFISNPVVHHQMRCNLMGHFSLTSQCNGWEVFRLVEVGNGELYISSWTHYTKFLSSNSDGLIYSTDMDTSLGFAERWRLEAPPKGNGLYIRNVASRRYLSVGRKRSEHLWTTTKPNDYALWHLNAPHSNVYYLTSLFASAEKQSVDAKDTNQQYFKDGSEEVHISSNNKGPFLSQKREKDEEWKMEATPEGYFTFFSVSNEKYLGCNSTGVAHTTTSKGAWTLWKREISPHGGVTFMSKEHQRYLAISATDGSLCTTQEEKETNFRHSWRIDPRLPRIVSGGTGGYIAGAMGLSLPVAIPFAVLGAIEAAEYNGSKTNEQEENIDGPKKNGLAPTNRPVSAWKSWVKLVPPSVPPTSAFLAPSPDTETTSNTHKESSITEVTSNNPKETSNTEVTSDNSKESSIAETTSDNPKESSSTEATSDDHKDSPSTDVTSDNPNETSNTEVTSDNSKESSITETTSDNPKESSSTEATSDDHTDPPSTDVTSDNPNETSSTEATSDNSKESSITETTSDNPKESSSTEATFDDHKDPPSTDVTSDNPNETSNTEVASDNSKESSITETTSENPKESSSTEATSDDPKEVDAKKE